MRKAWIGLIMAATAIAPIASAYAQDGSRRWQRGEGIQRPQQQAQGSSQPRQQRFEGRVQRAERQAQDAAGQSQRFERRMQRFERQAQGSDDRTQQFDRRMPRSERPAQSSDGPTPRFERRMQRVERQAQSSERQSQPSERRMPGFERSGPRVNPDSQPVQTGQWQRVRSQSDRSVPRYQRRRVPQTVQPTEQAQMIQTAPETRSRERWSGDRSWAQNRTRDGDRSRDGRRWSDDRNRDGNRSGSWDGRNYRWNRDGRSFSWNHDWRRNGRYDWQNHRRFNRFVFHVGPYHAPFRNYSYRRFSIGFLLEPYFFGSNYWLSDPWQYRLPPAPPGTRWIRYYDDVLLVDIYTGEVIDVIYDFFW